MQVLPPGRTGGPSRLFIMRPVATTLLMVAIRWPGSSATAFCRSPPCRSSITRPSR